MIELKEIKLEDRENFIKKYHKDTLSSSSSHFNNFFAWKDNCKTRYGYIGEALCIFQEYYGKKYMYYPLGDEKLIDVLKVSRDMFKEWGTDFRFFDLTIDMYEEIKKCCSHIEPYRARDNDEYIYNLDDLIKLEGKKYHSKRNHINKFKKDYDYTYSEMDKDSAKECILKLEEWNKDIESSKNKTAQDEFNAVKIYLNNFNELKLDGGLIIVNSEIVAFTAGYKYLDDTYVINVEKADIKYRTAYAVIGNEFCKNCIANKEVKFVNREEDLGIAGLRKAKQSYHPVKMIEKYEAVLKNV